MSVLLSAALFIISPALGQTASTANDAPWPLPDTRGADPNFLCYSVLLAESSRMPAGSAMREGLDVTIGIYVERLAQKFPDAASMNQAARGLATAFSGHTQDLPSFGRPCAQRAGIVIDRAKDALGIIASPSK